MKPRTPSPKAKPPGEIRIIGGQWKRSKLSVPDKPGLRPTPDRVRETLFNWLGHDLTDWRCLDAFAGTGALGFEAASRGASDVLLIEQDALLLANLQAVKNRLKAETVRIQRGDGLAIMAAQPAHSIDLIFLDPPFDSPLFFKALEASARIQTAQGAIYLEAPQAWTNEAISPFGLRVHKSGKAGAVHFHLLQKSVS
jgi:16S rRNA (guanine966-N2)-methyltransferase